MKLKKFCIIFVISQFFTFSIVSENVKIKIEGPERSYNQVRITNNTSYENFECKVYRLQQKDGKLIKSELLGVYNLKEKSDTDSCTMSLKRNEYIGISVPDTLGKISHNVSYKDLPFFDVVEVFLFDNNDHNVIGEEF